MRELTHTHKHKHIESCVLNLPNGICEKKSWSPLWPYLINKIEIRFEKCESKRKITVIFQHIFFHRFVIAVVLIVQRCYHSLHMQWTREKKHSGCKMCVYLRLLLLLLCVEMFSPSFHIRSSFDFVLKAIYLIL